MAVKKVEYRPPVTVGETITYPDEIHFKTSSDIVIMGDGTNLEETVKGIKISKGTTPPTDNVFWLDTTPE